MILGIIAAVITIAGFATALSDKARPTDVNATLVELHPLHPEPKSTVFNEAADVLLVKGRWVYDSGHSGWNELHPVTYCQKIVYIPNAPNNWINWSQGSGENLYRKWCSAVTVAQDPGTVTQQQLPENQWHIHPDVDGCEGSIVG
ncbi:hypothetical protein [Streptomyces sp. NPDC054783]